jgi:hypothetical protein
MPEEIPCIHLGEPCHLHLRGDGFSLFFRINESINIVNISNISNKVLPSTIICIPFIPFIPFLLLPDSAQLRANPLNS